MRKVFLWAALLGASAAHADCVVGAKMATSYAIVDPNTLILQGMGNGILIKSFEFFFAGASIVVLKDSFCDYDSAVLLVNGKPVNVQEVKQL